MAKKPRIGQGMHKEDIKAELRKRFGSMKAFADQCGVDKSILRTALYRAYPKAEALIAQALNTTPQALWPERYTDDVMQNHRHWRRHLNVLGNQFNTNVTSETVNKSKGK